MVMMMVVTMRVFWGTFGLTAAVADSSGAACCGGFSVAKVQIAVYAFARETEVLVGWRCPWMVLLLLLMVLVRMFLHRVYALTTTTSAGVVVEAAVALGFVLFTLLLVHFATVGAVQRIVMLVMGPRVMMVRLLLLLLLVMVCAEDLLPLQRVVMLARLMRLVRARLTWLWHAVSIQRVMAGRRRRCNGVQIALRGHSLSVYT